MFNLSPITLHASHQTTHYPKTTKSVLTQVYTNDVSSDWFTDGTLLTHAVWLTILKAEAEDDCHNVQVHDVCPVPPS